MKLLIFGLGYTATWFVADYGAPYSEIWATTRSGNPKVASVMPLQFDGISAPQNIVAAIAGVDHLLISIPPQRADDAVLTQFAAQIAQAKSLRSIVYLSTIGVYGDQHGNWVDETTAVNPSSERSKARVEAERGWLELGARSNKTVHILRLAGIYGHGQNAAENVLAGTARPIIKPNQVFNRIHVADIAQAIAKAFAFADTSRQGYIWNITDNEPAPPQDVIAFAAKVVNRPAPMPVAFDDALMSPMARSFYSDNKRVSNRAMIDDLHVRLLYPTYREGIQALASQIT